MAQESWKKETDETECQTPEGPVLCANNCGFFGSATTNNLCSKCYRDQFLKQQQLKMSQVVHVVDKMPSASRSMQLDSVVGRAEVEVGHGDLSSEGSASATTNQLLTNCCMSCYKRIGLTVFKCRCGGTFCSSHRYSEKHECTFDYKSAGRDAIAKANPVVKAEKIEKI